jgi:hypothetical protein
MDSLGDIYVKVFRKKSFKTEDRIFCSLMRIDDAVKLVGALQLLKVSFHTEYRDGGSDYKALSALVYLEEGQTLIVK